MRLLDHIAQCTAPFEVRQDSGSLWRLTGASDFSHRVRRCPLRYVLGDDLVRICVALAYSEGDELSGCLDLLHLPAEELWVEWSEPARREELSRTLPDCAAGPILASRTGVLIEADARGRAGRLRTFWLPCLEPCEPLLGPVETLIDLEGAAPTGPAQQLLEGRCIGVEDSKNPQVTALLRCASFRIDPAWQRYYQSEARDPRLRAALVPAVLASAPLDVPMLLALFLLLGIRADLVHTSVDPGRLNHKRQRLGRAPLLEHVEVSAPLFAPAARQPALLAVPARAAPRLHHVRGHIVRRSDTVYWRAPHWRGHLRLGQVRTRTVALRSGTAAGVGAVHH